MRQTIAVRKDQKLEEVLAKNLNRLMSSDESLGSNEKVEARSERLGKKVGRSTVDRIRRAEGSAKLDSIDSLADVFGVQPSDLLIPSSKKALNVAAKATSDEVEIPQYYGVGGSMGVGLLLRDQPGEIHGWRVTPEWISKNVKNHTGAGNLRIVTGFGDSMRPLYNPGDPLLVDAGVKAVEFDSIYFFRIGDEGFIKRLQRVPGQGLVAISENKSYRDWVITPDMDFEVFARVIKVWCGSDF